MGIWWVFLVQDYLKWVYLVQDIIASKNKKFLYISVSLFKKICIKHIVIQLQRSIFILSFLEFDLISQATYIPSEKLKKRTTPTVQNLGVVKKIKVAEEGILN